MGYYTYYNLELLNATNEQEAEIANWLAKNVFGDEEPNYTYICDLLNDSYKWYNHEDDIRTLSRLYPDIGFTLWGEGEDYDDKWVLYARDGVTTTSYATIVYADPPTEFRFDLLE